MARDPLFSKHLGARREPIYRDETEAFAAHELALRPDNNWDRVWAAMVESRKGVRYRYAVGGFVVWAHFSNSASFQAISPILPLITDDYGISYAKAGLLVGIVMMMQPIFGLPASMIAGRWPLKRALGVSWFLLAVPVLSFLSPGYLGLLGMRIAQGIGSAVMIPATGRLIMQWIPPRGRSFVNSLNPGGGSIGFMVALSTTAPLAGIMGWERAIGLFGAIGLAGAMSWLLFGKTRDESGSVASPLTLRDVRDVLRDRSILLVSISGGLMFTEYTAMSSWLPTFYNETRDMSLTQAGFITSLLPFTGIFAVLLGGVLPMKIGPRRLFFIVPGAMAGLGVLGTFMVDHTGLTYASVIVLGMGSWLFMPSMLTAPMEAPGMTPQKTAIAWGFITVCSGAGMSTSPLIVGAMRDAFDSFIPGFALMAVLPWSMFIAGFLLPGPRTAQPAATVAPAPAEPESGDGGPEDF